MNIALNLLPTQSIPTQPSASKSTNSSSTKGQSKASFSDTLDKAVAKSDEATDSEQQQVAGENPIETAVTNNSNKKNNTSGDKEQTSTDSTASPATDDAAPVAAACPCTVAVNCDKKLVFAF